MNPLKLAVIGVGALGRHHARILSQMEGVTLEGVSDVNLEAAQRVADDCGTRAVADYRELLECVDAVSIVVPTVVHLPVAAECLQRGLPVLVEKPLAATADEARQLVELAEARQTLLQVGHIERFNPAYEAARRRIAAPKYIRAERVSPFPFRSTDIGVVLDLMIHDLELVLDLNSLSRQRAGAKHSDSPRLSAHGERESRIRSVEAFGISIVDHAHEDAVTARIHFENGCIADLTASRVCPVARRTIQIWSQAGCVTADLGAREVVGYGPTDALLFGPSPVERSRQAGADIEELKRDIFGKFIRVDRPEAADTDALTAELRSFVDCVRHNRQPVVGGRQALAALELAERVLESVAAHQWEGHPGGSIGPFHLAGDRFRRAA